jgi:acetyltransferase-like isoleucine patch superfamily enzyme
MNTGYYSPGGGLLKNVRMSSSSVIHAPEKLRLADDVFIGHFNFIEASNGISIGRGCQITNFISILSHSSHISIRLYGSHYSGQINPKGYVTGEVIIGEYTFIGPHTVIMPDSRIGKGCLIAAYSYVKGDFPDFSVIQGNPAVVAGDVRKIDEPFLIEHPGLREYYNEWSGKSE